MGVQYDTLQMSCAKYDPRKCAKHP